ncbi:unnamed protein product [Lathyrus oleraceus]
MQPEGNLSFDPGLVCLYFAPAFFPIGYGSIVSVISFYGFSIWLWFRYRLNTFFRALISAGGSRVAIAPDHSK